MHRGLRSQMCFLVLGCTLALAGPSSLRADFLSEETSLKLIPADASIYVTSLRLKEQWDVILGSRAYARLREMPWVKLAIDKAQEAWDEQSEDEDFAPIIKFLSAEENGDLLSLGRDLISHEVFVYGDEHVTELFKTLLDVNQKMSSIQWKGIGKGEVDEDQLRTEVMTELIDAVSDMEVPRLAFGFRTKMTDVASRELGRLEELASKATDEVPTMKGRVQRIRDRESGSDLLTMRVDPSVIPWEQAIEENEEMAEQLEDLRDALSDREIVIALGVYKDYVIIQFGPDADLDAEFGSGDRLWESEKFARLRRHSDKRIDSVSYVSEDFARSANNTQQSMDQLRNMAEQVIPLMEIDEEFADDLVSDAKELIQDIEDMIPEP
ncbi:MAG TPA: hypothetical protein VIY86_03285, partial [Pirellulaceae bacterium]